LFIHIPKNGGTSVSHALYGVPVGHSTIRYYQFAAPHLVADLPSFAILRDPEERFLSSYRHAVAGGAANSWINPFFRNRYRKFRSVDDALDHLQGARSVYAIDHIFRPQSWYVTDHRGVVAVDQLLTMGELSNIGDHLPDIRRSIPHLNRSRPITSSLTTAQRRRVRAIYAGDYDLIEGTGALAARSEPGPLPAGAPSAG
jgi:hypothetical protein